MIRATKNIVMAMFMNSISNEERKSKEMVGARSVLVMVLVLALWLLARYVDSDGLQEEVAKQRSSKRVSAGEEESI